MVALGGGGAHCGPVRLLKRHIPKHEEVVQHDQFLVRQLMPRFVLGVFLLSMFVYVSQ